MTRSDLERLKALRQTWLEMLGNEPVRQWDQRTYNNYINMLLTHVSDFIIAIEAQLESDGE